MPSDVLSLIAEAHQRCLQLICHAGGRHFQGLSHGVARCLPGTAHRALRRKLRDLDVAYAIARHINVQKIDLTLQELGTALACDGTPSPADAHAEHDREPADEDALPQADDRGDTPSDCCDISDYIHEAAANETAAPEVHGPDAACPLEPVHAPDVLAPGVECPHEPVHSPDVHGPVIPEVPHHSQQQRPRLPPAEPRDAGPPHDEAPHVHDDVPRDPAPRALSRHLSVHEGSLTAASTTATDAARFLSGDLVASRFGGLFEVVRIGLGDYSAMVRLRGGHEDHSWQSGSWHRISNCSRPGLGSVIGITGHLPIDDDEVMVVGAQGLIREILQEPLLLEFPDMMLTVYRASWPVLRHVDVAV